MGGASSHLLRCSAAALLLRCAPHWEQGQGWAGQMHGRWDADWRGWLQLVAGTGGLLGATLGARLRASRDMRGCSDALWVVCGEKVVLGGAWSCTVLAAGGGKGLLRGDWGGAGAMDGAGGSAGRGRGRSRRRGGQGTGRCTGGRGSTVGRGEEREHPGSTGAFFSKYSIFFGLGTNS